MYYVTNIPILNFSTNFLVEFSKYLTKSFSLKQLAICNVLMQYFIKDSIES